MKIFPITCVDNFYKDPDKIREYALSLEFFPSTGHFPGKRTKNLSEIDPVFFNEFTSKLSEVYVDISVSSARYEIDTCFQLIDTQDEDPNSLKNIGWIHCDLGYLLAGIIYLNPEIDSTCGTSIFKLVEDTICGDDIKGKFYRDRIDDNYDSTLLKNNSGFKETVRFSNEYNRMITFDYSEFHAANYFYSKTQRLTQVFFFKDIQSDSVPPIVRLNRHKL